MEYLKLGMRDAKYEFTIRQCVTMAESYIQRSEDEFYTLDEMKEYVLTTSLAIILLELKMFLFRKLIDDRFELKTLLLSDDSDFSIGSQIFHTEAFFIKKSENILENPMKV